MTRYQLQENLHVVPSPAGAYYAVSRAEEEVPRRLLRKLLTLPSSPQLSVEGVCEWAGMEDEESAMELLSHIQTLGWIEGMESPVTPPEGRLEDTLPDLLAPLSGNGKVLLADDQGFYLCSRGFAHETAEELSALSADLATLHERHAGLLKSNLGLRSNAWAVVDAAGNSEVGFWPMYIGEQRFVLVAGGVPRLNQPAVTQLIWALSIRYAGG